MNFLQSSWILAFVFAFVLYGAAKMEDHSSVLKGPLWAALSVAISIVVIRLCGGGWLLELLAQGGLLVGIGAVRAALDTKRTAKSR